MILASAAALFVAAVGLARITHPARTSQPATSSSSGAPAASTSSSQQLNDDESSGDGYYGPGSIVPSQSAPQLSTGGS